MRVDVEHVLFLKGALKIINNLNLKDIELYENDKKIEIPKSVKDQFEFSGLMNTDFITGRYWEEAEE